MNTSEPIRRNARIAPDSAAFLRVDGTTVSYATLDQTIDALAHRLRDLSLEPGNTAALLTNDGYRYLVLVLALARIGVAAAPATLPPALADIALSYKRGDVANFARVTSLDDLWPHDLLAGGAPAPAPTHADGGAVLAYCPSSGTTGAAPKFVPMSHDLMRRRIAIRAMSAPVFGGPRQTCVVGLTSIFGLGRMLRTLWSGSVVVEPNLDAQEFASWLVASRVNHIAISPIGLQKILDLLPEDGAACSVETIEVGGGILPRSIFELAQRRLPGTLIATYGATETGPVAAAPMDAIVDRPGAVGFPFPGVTVEVVDADDRPVAAGEEGILRVRSAHAASAYIGNDAAASTVFRDGWVYPNDRAIIDHDGLLRLMGRTDDVIVVGGVKVNPQAIEDVLFTLADLREAAVFGAPDDSGLVALCAAIVPKAPLVADEFHARCRARLGAQAPVFIMHLRELPRNAMGKVQRNELARMAVAASRGRAAPLQRGPLH